MRINSVLLSSWLAVALSTGSVYASDNNMQRRQQNTDSISPTLSSTSASVSASASTAAIVSSSTASAQSSTITGFSTINSSISSLGPRNSSTISSSISTTAPTSTPVPVSSSTTSNAEGLPLTPKITPALSVAGVVLILTGIAYALVGIKNRWLHIFLSTAFLTSLSICVLIVYVINPPVSNAIQGAYFVGIFMTGIIFGSGALVFKEVTEGLGCLLGGFTLAMWFLTLKDGGLITNTAGKGIFIAIFCVLAWSLSFSHHTRAYGLIGSTAFSGSTAFVLGIDCFSRGGLKEFWLYIWGLSPSLFPLNTNTYPITRGTRVETIVIILGCILGIISQMKLWKVVQDRQKKKEAAAQEEERRRDAVEAALGKHLERRNDRDRNQWEKQYGDTLKAKRDTVLWTDTVSENKKYAQITETEIGDGRRSRSYNNMEMSLVPRQSRPIYGGRLQRQSTMTVDAIKEENEPSDKVSAQQESLAKLEGNNSEKDVMPTGAHITNDNTQTLQASRSLRDSHTTTSSVHRQAKSATDDLEKGTPVAREQLSPPEDEKKKNRLSWSSVFSKSSKTSNNKRASQSQEALVVPATTQRYSRASSLAATLDFENEVLDLPQFDIVTHSNHSCPDIVVSEAEPSDPVAAFQKERDASYRVADVPPSPPALSEISDVDLEELVRPPTVQQMDRSESRQTNSGPDSTRPHTRAGSEDAADRIFDENLKSHTLTSNSSRSETLRKGVLEQMPTQLSHVAMSYRTNEWAKHISTAEAPIYEEPQNIDDNEAEAPVHLALPEEFEDKSPIAQPPPLAHTREKPSPIEAAISSPTDGVRVNPAIQSSRQSSTAPKAGTLAKARSSSDLQQSAIPRGFRSSSTPLISQSTQIMIPEEHTKTQHNPRQNVVRSTSAQSYNGITGRVSPALSSYAGMVRTSMGPRALSRLSHVSEISGTGEQIGNIRPLRVPTRLSSYDSHQPAQRDSLAETQRREAVLTDWRMSQQKQPAQDVEAHRMQMVMQRQQAKAMDDMQRNMKLQHEMAMDAKMRSRDMQELHREALRKMQANANRSLA